jgi:hypothetical protein
MTEPSLALQTVIRSRLIAAAGVTSLVPAANILDRNGRPEAMPCILIGDGQTAFADNYYDFYDRAYADLHLWTQEQSLEGVKAIAGAVRTALPTGVWIIAGFTVPRVKLTTARFMRDPDNEHSHAVVSVEAVMRASA